MWRYTGLLLAFLGASSTTALRTPERTAASVTGMPEVVREESDFSGIVREVHDVGYSYLRVTREDGEERWVVTLSLAGRVFSVDDTVRVKGFGTRQQFFSKRLERAFDHLTFALVTKLD
jgi:hypothetical protein